MLNKSFIMIVCFIRASFFVTDAYIYNPMASLFSLIMCIEQIVLFLHDTPKRPHLQTRTMLGLISSNHTTKGGSSFLIIKGSAPRQNRKCIMVVDVNYTRKFIYMQQGYENESIE